MALEPITREETYLAAAAGQIVETPEPITRKEMFLDAIAKSGGGGGTGGGTGGGGGSSGGSSTNGNVYFNKASTLYTVTAEDVENYTAGDAFIVSVDNLKGDVRIATINLRHPSGTGGTVLKKMDICGADPNKKYNNYRFGSNPDCNNRTIAGWQDRWGTYIFTYGSDCIRFSGVSSFSGTEAANATKLMYWADQNLYPVTSFCISCVFDTLVEGLQIELNVVEEVSA